MSTLKKKYGLLTAISMVVGIVIGSGVFFKAQSILTITNGNMPLGILAWIIGGAVMLLCAYTFSTMANKYEKVNGIVDYAEVTVGGKYAYLVGWFMTLINYPTLVSVLAWLSARYTMELFGSNDITGGTCLALSCLYLISSYTLNTLSPTLAGKFQVSTTFIKLVPLLLMAIVGTIVGLNNGTTKESFSTIASGDISSLFPAVVASAFAYEGWIIATSINAEIKNSRRNLPIALTFGSIIIIAVYIVYYIGLAGSVSVDTLIEKGAMASFVNIFGNVGGKVLQAFVAVSCLGTLNGLMIGCTRGMYSLAIRNMGPAPHIFKEVDKNTDMPVNSSIFGLLISAVWLFYYYCANLRENIFSVFGFDSSELPIVTTYALFIPIFISFISKSDGGNILKNKIMPILAVLASCFMIYAAIYAHGVKPYLETRSKGYFSCPILFYFIVFSIIMGIGCIFYNHNKNRNNKYSNF